MAFASALKSCIGAAMHVDDLRGVRGGPVDGEEFKPHRRSCRSRRSVAAGDEHRVAVAEEAVGC